MPLFGDYELRLDPWELEKGPEFVAQAAADAADGVDLDVEFPFDQWQAIRPTDAPDVARVAFVDGTRRVEARVLAQRDGKTIFGAFGAFGVGATAHEAGQASFGESITGRVLALSGGACLPSPVEISEALTYQPKSSPEDDPNAPVAALQEEMRLAEARLAYRLADREGALVVTDGPLSFGDTIRGAAVGFIKRIHELYLPGSAFRLLAEMPAGTRTPLFSLKGRFPRYSCFLRLDRPRPGDFALSGLCRLEVAAAMGVDAARRLTQAAAATIPRFATHKGRDPRAPQNLLPISALEARLKRQLGDLRSVQRAVQTAIARDALQA